MPPRECNLDVWFSSCLWDFITDYRVLSSLSPGKHKGHLGEKDNFLSNYPFSCFDPNVSLRRESNSGIANPTAYGGQAGQPGEGSEPVQNRSELTHGCSKRSNLSAPATRCHAGGRPFAPTSSVSYYFSLCTSVSKSHILSWQLIPFFHKHPIHGHKHSSSMAFQYIISALSNDPSSP